MLLNFSKYGAGIAVYDDSNLESAIRKLSFQVCLKKFFLFARGASVCVLFSPFSRLSLCLANVYVC